MSTGMEQTVGARVDCAERQRRSPVGTVVLTKCFRGVSSCSVIHTVNRGPGDARQSDQYTIRRLRT